MYRSVDMCTHVLALLLEDSHVQVLVGLDVLAPLAGLHVPVGLHVHVLAPQLEGLHAQVREQGEQGQAQDHRQGWWK